MANDKKNNGYLAKVRDIFKDVGIDTKDPALVAGATAMLFDKLSGVVETNIADDVNWEKEDEVIRALTSWRKLRDKNQVNVARAIYRLTN